MELDWPPLLRGLAEALPTLAVPVVVALIVVLAFRAGPALRGVVSGEWDAGGGDSDGGPSLALIFGAALAFGMLASGIGYMAGSSRTNVLGQVLPAVMTLVGGYSVYLFGKPDEDKVIVGVAVFGFSVCLLVSFVVGTAARSTSDAELAAREAQRAEDAARAALDRRLGIAYDVEFQTRLAQQEARINGLRHALGLPVLDFAPIAIGFDPAPD